MSGEFLQELKGNVEQYEIEQAQEQANRIRSVANGYVSLMRKRLRESSETRGRIWATLTPEDSMTTHPLKYEALDLARADFAFEGFEAKVEDTTFIPKTNGSLDLCVIPTKELSVWHVPETPTQE
jgi:ferredoxin-NADP reductase